MMRSILALALLSIACGRTEMQNDNDDPEAQTPAAAPARALLPCAEFVRAVQADAAGSRADVHARFGEPDSTVVSTEPNRHMPDATDTIVRLHFPETSAQLRTAGGRDLLEMVEFRGNQHLPADAPVMGTSRERIRTAYGTPEYAAGDTLAYMCNATEAGGETVRFVFRQDSLMSVAVGFYVD